MSFLTCFTIAHGGGHEHVSLDVEAGWTFALRFIETALLSAPTILSGLVVAGILRAIVTPPRLNRLIGDHPLYAPLKLVLLSLLTPVCALGAIPIAAELKRAGVRVSHIATFLITAPMLNVLWMAYGYDAMSPLHWTMTMAVAVLVALSIGRVAGWRDGKSQVDRYTIAPSIPARLKATACGAVAAMNGSMLFAVIAALVAASTIGAVLGHGAVEHRLAEAEYENIGWLATVMPLAYMTPDMSVVSAKEVFRIGLLPGAAVPMIVGGVALCLGTFVWIGLRMGVKTLARFVVAAWLSIVAGAFVLQAVAPIDHQGIADSHAFDHLNRPYQSVHSAQDVIETVRRGFSDDLTPVNPVALSVLAGMALVYAVRRRKIDEVFQPTDRQAPDESHGSPESNSWMNRPMSARSLIVSIVAVLVVGGAFSVYIIFPPPPATFAELDKTYGLVFQAVALDDRDEALARAIQAERLVSRLHIGSSIRPWGWCEACDDAIDRFQRDLNLLRSEIDDADHERLRSLSVTANQALRSYRLSAQLR